MPVDRGLQRAVVAVESAGEHTHLPVHERIELECSTSARCQREVTATCGLRHRVIGSRYRGWLSCRVDVVAGFLVTANRSDITEASYGVLIDLPFYCQIEVGSTRAREVRRVLTDIKPERLEWREVRRGTRRWWGERK